MHRTTKLLTLIKQFQQNHLQINTALDEKLEFSINSQWDNRCLDLKKTSVQTTTNQLNLAQIANQIDFYQIINLLFSDNSHENSLDLQIFDTMFFQHDQSINYIYKDSKKGLIKTKQKGIVICDMFVKRKLKSKPYDRKDKPFKNKSQNNFFIEQKQKQKAGNNSLGYICLLRYKDGSFIRLKEYDLRSIFTNPLYANEKFKCNNCTRYIQCLGQQGAQQWKIYYNWQKYKDESLFKLSVDCLSKSIQIQEKKEIKNQMLNNHPLVYLHFLVFEICSFITIRHNKRILNGIFSFVKDNENWSLSNIQSAQILTLPQKQFSRINLWSNCKKVKFTEISEQQFLYNKQQVKTQLQKEVQMYFEANNNKIKQDMLQFVQAKMEHIKKPKDKLLSKTIFQILHPGCKQNFYDLLDNSYHIEKIICPKQNVPVKLHKKYNNFMSPPQTKQVRRTIKKKEPKQVFVYRGIEAK